MSAAARLSSIPYAALLVAALALPGVAHAQSVTARTIALPPNTGKHFILSGDRAITVEIEADPAFGAMLVGTALQAGMQDAANEINKRHPGANATVDGVVNDPEQRLGNRLNAKLSAVNLTGSATTSWQRTVIAADSGAPEGRTMVRPDATRGRLFTGAAPLTAIDAATGAVQWTRPCKEIGNVDLGLSRVRDDGSLLAVGAGGCTGNGAPILQLLDGATGAQRWQLARKFNLRGGQRREFAVIDRPLDRYLVVGDVLELIDGKAGTVVWTTDAGVGSLERILPGDIAVFTRDQMLDVRSLADGKRLWSSDIGPGLMSVALANAATSETSDIVVFTARGVTTLERATGKPRWKKGWMMDDEDTKGGSGIATPIVLVATFASIWEGLDATTGNRTWRYTFSGSGGRERRWEPSLSAAQTGVLLFVAGAPGMRPPFTMTGVDLATGKELWKTSDVAKENILGVRVVDSTAIVVTGNGGKALGNLDVKTGVPLVPDATASSTGYVLSYDARAKVLTCLKGKGVPVWTRDGEQSRYSRVTMLEDRGVVVWTTADGVTEIVALAKGTSLLSQKGDPKRRVAVDRVTGRVFVAQGNSAQLLSITKP